MAQMSQSPKTPVKKSGLTSKAKIAFISLSAAAAVLIVVIAFFLTNRTPKPASSANADLVIPLSGVTDKAGFYPVDIDGTKMEVIAVKAPDGTIRTAFNTCQVCYSSGRGYYKQVGDQLVCQNCGNRFGMGDVEKVKGGCNPVPITSEDKTIDDANITISKSFLEQSKAIFANWKK